MKARQTPMFQTEDLPLFSGTPQPAKVNPFTPTPSAIQARLPICQFCAGTGITGTRLFCSCEAGTQARVEASR